MSESDSNYGESGRIVAMSDAPAEAREDAELLRACAEFDAAHLELDRLVEDDSDPSDADLYQLNKRWKDACVWVISLPAVTSAGLHAKAQILLAVTHVVLGTDTGNYGLHELLAVSLARDC